MSNQSPAWDRQRLAGAVDSEPDSTTPSPHKIYGDEEPDDSDETLDWFVPFDGQAVEAVPNYAIDRLLQPKSFYERFPWPYSPQEMGRIMSMIPFKTRIFVAFDIVLRARIFLYARIIRKKLPKKSNPRGEINRLHAALRELSAAISALSIDSKCHLEPPATPRSQNQEKRFKQLPTQVQNAALDKKAEISMNSNHRSHFYVDQLQNYIFRFQIHNRHALENPPAIEGRGRPKSPEANVRSYFAGLFVAAHDGIKPARGQPKFVELCCAPLNLTHISPEGVEKSLSRKGRQKGT